MPTYLNPNSFVLIRIVGSLLLFYISSLFVTKEKIDKKDYKYFLLCAIFGIAVNQLLFFNGLNKTTPIHSAIMMVFSPIVVVLIAVFMKKEKMNFLRWFGILLGTFGALYLVTSGFQVNVKSDGNFIGDIMIFVNAISWSVYLVMARKLMAKYNTFTVMKTLFFLGFFMVLPFGIGELEAINFNKFNTQVWASIAYVVIATTFLAYLFNNLALKILSPGAVGVYIYMQPLLASFFSIILTNEKIDSIKVISTVIIFTGVYLSAIKKYNT